MVDSSNHLDSYPADCLSPIDEQDLIRVFNFLSNYSMRAKLDRKLAELKILKHCQSESENQVKIDSTQEIFSILKGDRGSHSSDVSMKSLEREISELKIEIDARNSLEHGVISAPDLFQALKGMCVSYSKVCKHFLEVQILNVSY